MSCDAWREQLSARADGEDDPRSARLLDAHLDRCPACRSYAAALAGIGVPGVADRNPPGPPADLPARVRGLNAAADRAASYSTVRVLLGVVAVQIVVLSVADLVGGHGLDGEAGHSVRHLGAFTLAYAVGLLAVVVRPARARTILPVAAVLAGALVIGAVVDLAQGRIPLGNEFGHLPELLSVVLVWLMANSARRRTFSDSAPVAVTPLRVVPDAPESRRDAG